MLIAVLLDTSASMNQRTAANLSLLDAAKAAIELMLQRLPNERAAKFMLVTTRGGGTVEAGWRDPPAAFVHKVKMATARDNSDLGGGLRCCLDLLARERGFADVDEYGQGRRPWDAKEAAAVWLLTDGCELSTPLGVQRELVLPPGDQNGGDVFVDAFRWDTRVWVTVLRLPGCGTVPVEWANNLGPAAEFAERTGGRTQVATNIRGLMGAVESLSARLQLQMVAVSFASIPLDPSGDSPRKSPAAACTTLVGMRAQGRAPVESMFSWPIPEPFVLPEGATALVPRPSVPTILYRLVAAADAPHEAAFVPREAGAPPGAGGGAGATLDLLNPDVYEVDNCAVTELLRAEARASPRCVLRLFVAGSAGTANAIGEPFGFLRLAPAAHAAQAPPVQMVLLPYNYPRLLAILDDLKAAPKGPAPAPLRQELDAYVRSVPAYYLKALRVALKNVRPPLPVERNEPPVPASVQATLKRYRQIVEEAKEAKRMSDIAPPGAMPLATALQGDARSFPLLSSPALPDAPPLRSLIFSSPPSAASAGHAVLDPTEPTPPSSPRASPASPTFDIEGVDDSMVLERDDREASPFGATRQPMMAAYEAPKSGDGIFKNVFDIPKESLLVQLRRMRFRLLGKQASRADQRVEWKSDRTRHSVPISEMGNFHEVLRKREAANPGSSPLRDPLDDADRRNRRPQFGNPFRKGDKGGQGGFMSDEIDEAAGAGARVKRERRRLGAKRASSLGPGSASDSDSSRDSSPSNSRETSPVPDGKARAGSVPGEGRAGVLTPGGVAVGVADPADGENPASRSSSATEGATEEVHESNRWQVKLALVRLVKTKGRDHTALLRRVERLRGDKDMTRKLVEQLAEAARVHRRAALAEKLLLLAQLQQ